MVQKLTFMYCLELKLNPDFGQVKLHLQGLRTLSSYSSNVSYEYLHPNTTLSSEDLGYMNHHKLKRSEREK
jgi:hypothetical protein